MSAPAEIWPRLFELPEELFGPAAAWARAHAAHAADPARSFEECPRGDWLVAAAALAGVDARELVGAVAMTLSAVCNELDRAGRPEPPTLRRAIETSEAWADGAAEEPEVRAELDALGADTTSVAWALLYATANASHHAAIEADGSAPAGARVWARHALARQAAHALRLLAEGLGPRGGEATAAMLRSLVEWPTVEAALAATFAEGWEREVEAATTFGGALPAK